MFSQAVVLQLAKTALDELQPRYPFQCDLDRRETFGIFQKPDDSDLHERLSEFGEAWFFAMTRTCSQLSGPSLEWLAELGMKARFTTFIYSNEESVSAQSDSQTGMVLTNDVSRGMGYWGTQGTTGLNTANGLADNTFRGPAEFGVFETGRRMPAEPQKLNAVDDG
ncbi:MAG: hypothetical protein Q9208_002438 [Pyrenodesmia sp. 3 TL-2023]